MLFSFDEITGHTIKLFLAVSRQNLIKKVVGYSHVRKLPSLKIKDFFFILN